MKYLETKHQRNSAKITSLITIILLLLLFVVGLPFMDPPLEYGVAVNFGNSNVGSGTKPKAIPVKAPTKKVVEEVKPQPSEPQEVKETAKTEDVITDDTAETIAIKKQKEAEAKARAEAERIERERKAAEEQRLREEAEKAEKRKNLDNLIGGVKNSKSTDNGGEGPDNSAGNKGKLNGDPYAPSYFGGAGPGKGGVGYGLNGRGRPTREIFKQDCNEYGVVVVQIKVNRNGQVISATPGARGTTNSHPCLIEPAKKIALSHRWPADENAPSEQVGFVSINFDVTD